MNNAGEAFEDAVEKAHAGKCWLVVVIAFLAIYGVYITIRLIEARHMLELAK